MSGTVVVMMLLTAAELPAGNAPAPVSFPHFPDRLHAFVWLNWELVPMERMAACVGATPEQIHAIGRRMGLADPPAVSEEQWLRSYITVIRRNWHLLPYEQLLALLGWSADELAYTLREDDFLFIKLGSHKPACAPLRYATESEETLRRAEAVGAAIHEAFPDGLAAGPDPLFGFVARLSAPPEHPPRTWESRFAPRFCPSYFAIYGDPFLQTKAESFPDGYLARLADAGVDGVWVQAVLYTLVAFPWDAARSARHAERLDALARLAARMRRHGLGLYLYLNEPRAMPLSFFEGREELRGVVEGDHAAMCTSNPAVRDYLRGAVAGICRAAPDLAGFFTISASENLTNCWSHHRGMECPRCKDRSPEEVIAELHAVLREGIAEANHPAGLIAWDWGWRDEWVEGIIAGLPQDVALQSVSEWSLPVERGGVRTEVGEYSLSAVGPGPRATRHWALARARGLKTMAKVQTNNTWELAAVPYIPVVALAARHAANLRTAHVEGLMLSWTLGGYPSPNLEVFAEMGRPEEQEVDVVLRRVAARRFGEALAPAAVAAWQAFSAAFTEYPYHIGVVYSGPQHVGPANPLWEHPTGYAPTMVGFPYDGLDGWRTVYPPEVFIAQFEKMADGFDAAIVALQRAAEGAEASAEQRMALDSEITIAEACAIHFRSVANQSRFVLARNALAACDDAPQAAEHIAALETALQSERELAIRLYALQRRDSRIGFEASNHYFYVPLDLAAKVINCNDLLTRWLPAERARFGV